MLPNKIDAQISLYEAYTLAKDKEKFIDKLVPNSQTYNLIKLTHELNSTTGRNIDYETEKKIRELMNKSRRDPEAKKIIIKYFLNQIQKISNRDKLKDIFEEFNHFTFNCSFDYRKPAKVEVTQNLTNSTEKKVKSKIPEEIQKQLELETYVEEIMAETNYVKFWEKFKKLNQYGLQLVDAEILFKKFPQYSNVFAHYLQNQHDFSNVKNVEKLISEFKKLKKKQNRNYCIPSYYLRKLTMVQLLKLKQLDPEFSAQQEFNKILMVKMFQKKDVESLKNYPEKEKKYLKNILSWAKENVKSDLLVSMLTRCLLVNSIYLNDYNIDLFLEYIKRPGRIYPKFNQTFKDQLSHRVLNSNSWRDASLIPNHLYNYDENNLVEKYLVKVLRESENFQKTFERLNKYFDEFELRKMIIVTKLQRGEKVEEEISKYLSENEVKELREKKSLKILEHNKKRFLGVSNGENEKGDKVEIDLEIKNIKSLTVKTFEINTLSYYKNNKSTFEDDIDLDGLIPATQQEYNFSSFKEIQVFTHKFEFEEISKKSRGLFVIEFVGGGFTSRAVIRKGALTLVRQSSANGLTFIILNEKKKICKGKNTGILVNKKFFTTNEKGEIFIPYCKDKKIKEEVVLVHNNFADIAPFEVPKDSYCFFTSLIFNEESLQVGHTVKFIIIPKLLLNLKVVTLEKIFDTKVTIATTNENGIKSYKTYKDLKLSYIEDLEIDFMMPAKIQQVNVRIDAKIKNLKGDEILLKAEDDIFINRHKSANTFYSTFLRWTQDGYKLRLLGKNGENLKNKNLQISLTRNFQTSGQIKFNVNTGENGDDIYLGQLPNVCSVGVSFPGSGLATKTWMIKNTSRNFHIQNEYEICKGEDLVIPNFGQKPDVRKHSLTKLEEFSSEYPINNFFSSIKTDGGNFVLKGLSVGNYKFVYRGEINFSVFITILKGKRWKHSQNYIDHSNKLSKMLSDLNYLTYENLEFKEGKLKMKINGNQMKNTKIHIMGYLHYPDNHELFHKVTRRLCPTFMKETSSLAYYENSYLSERLLPDEIQYVLERRTRDIYMGNMLERPPVLLKRHFNKNTTQETEFLRQGKDFGDKLRGKNEKGFVENRRGNVSSKKAIGYKVETIGEFLGAQGLALANEKPNEDGNVEIDIPNFENYSNLQIFIIDPMSMLSTEISMPENPPKMLDFRLQTPKKQGFIYSANRYNVKLNEEGEIGNIQDLKNTQYAMISSLEDLFDSMKLLCGYGNIDTEEFEKWRFLTSWSELSKFDKLKKYEEFQSHELNAFIYFKDPEFFSECVATHLTSKSHLDVLDYILLGEVEEVKKILSLWNIENLNFFEISLAILLLKSEGVDVEKSQAMLNLVKSATNLRKNEEGDEFNLRFDTILEGKRVEQSGGGGRVLHKYGGKGVGKGVMRDKAGLGQLKRFDSRDYLGYNEAPMGRKRRKSTCYAPVMKKKPKPAKKNKAKKMRRQYSRSMDSASSVLSEDSAYSEDEEFSQLSMASIVYSAAAPNFDLDAGILQNNDVTLEVDNIFEPVYDSKEVEKTKEYIERQYYYPENKNKISLNKFWAEAIEHFIKDELDYFNLSSNFIFSCNSITEMLAVLSIMTFDITNDSPVLTSDQRSLKIEAKNPTLIFCKETKEQEVKREEKLDLDVMVSQCFFDPNDKFIYDQMDTSIKILKKTNTFITGRRYTSKVTVTNSSEVPLALQLLTEIPGKSIPINNLKESQTRNILVQPMTTTVAQFDFYFPQEGYFGYYPATVLKNGRFVKSAGLLKTSHIEGIEENGILRVFARKVKGEKMETINDVLSLGKKSDILKFMESANLLNENVFNIKDILWLLKDREFYLSVLEVMKKKLMFIEEVWSFSIFHGLKQEFYEYLAYKKNHNPLSNFKFLQLGQEIKIERLTAKEYHPLTNPRIHDIGDHKHNILNNDFKICYRDFLQYCFEKGTLLPKDHLILCSYLILQDRVKQALEIFNTMNPENYRRNNVMNIQYDYLCAYLSLYTEYPEFNTAREISEKYIAHHLISWRNRFINIANQLTEFDGGEFVNVEEPEGGNVEVFEDQAKEKKIDPQNTRKKEILRAKLKGDKIELRTRNVDNVVIKYYLTDLEFLFSKDPFLAQGMNTFIYVQANKKNIVQIDKESFDPKSKDELNLTILDIPEDLKTKNLLIYVDKNMESLTPLNAGKTFKKSQNEKPILLTFFPITFKLQIFPNSGMIRTSDSTTKKPLSKIYIKSFCRTESGNIKFFKDGYTDLRGIFDYAEGVSTGEKIKQFSILVKDEKLGSIVRVVDAPSGFGRGGVIQRKSWMGFSTKVNQKEGEVESVEIMEEGLRKKQIELLKTFGEV